MEVTRLEMYKAYRQDANSAEVLLISQKLDGLINELNQKLKNK
ncbi:Spo0E family sporulation regulatory protein-aspartic acid phosphatase [Virgibacillus sp. W0181]